MELTLPVYIEVRRESGQPIHFCQPLFFSGPLVRDAQLGLAMSKLGRELKPHLDTLGQDSVHNALAQWAFSPPLETHVLKLQIDLKDRMAKTRLLFAVFTAMERRIVFSPSLPELWFEVMRGEDLEARAKEIVTKYFRDHQKAARRSGGTGATPERIALQGQAWVTTMDLQVNTRQVSAKKLERRWASLFDESHVDGGTELSRVGRCLNWLYPNELQRAVERDDEVSRLFRILKSNDNRPIALVGPRQSGKTTVLHEVVRRRVAEKGKPFSSKQNVWLLSPQRLISGMMYVGQWEGRVQAILKVARKRRHILYFDDFLGLYQAGISSDAHLSVAEMIKPYILRRQVRVLAEMTPEVFQAFQERDRGLADQFDVLRVDAMGEEATLRVMLNVQRELEGQHHVKFDLAALPTILQLHRSYLRDSAFPGKSAAFSQRLAQKYAKQSITRETVYAEFHHQTGLSVALLDHRQKLDRDEVVANFRKKIVSQDEAVQAAADVVSIAKARLAAPDRPLATLLFLGPTGVGKTQCARALAEVMFSDPGRLLRFDMNEYVTPHAVARLVGTFDEPDGILTSAVRRQPFAVVLLDEIEKAHPDVFDLLLQVTGEGRLTDALGRTADFSNVVVVMTSNLGTSASNQQLGLAPARTTRRQTFLKAAENFFRPEFFNRLDRVIPFDALTREEMREIAELVLANVFQRDGLVRRRCALSVDPTAMEHIVNAGYHPQFGARALKRAIEQQLVQPVAASLAGIKPELPAVISIYPHVEGVQAAVHPLESVPPSEQSLFAELAPADQLARIEQFTERVQDELETLRPASSSDRGVSSEFVFYYAIKEQLHQLRELLEVSHRILKSPQRAPIKPELAPRQITYSNRLAGSRYRFIRERRILREIQAADDIHLFLREQIVDVAKPGELVEHLTNVRHEAAMLHAMLTTAHMPQSVLLMVRPISTTGRAVSEILALCLFSLFGGVLKFGLSELDRLGFAQKRGLDPSSCTQEWNGPRQVGVQTPFLGKADRLSNGQAAEISGPGAWPLVSAETGVHLWCHFHEHLLPISVHAVLRNQQTAHEQLESLEQQRRQWLAELAAGRATPEDAPEPYGKIVRIYDEDGPTLDLRTGSSLAFIPRPMDLKKLVLGGLPLPPELEI